MKDRRQITGIVACLLFLATLGLSLSEAAVRAIWPSLVALLLVFLSRRVLLGLFSGAFAGAMLLAGGRLWEVPLRLTEDHLLPHFGSSWKVGAILFTLLLGGFVHLLERGGVLEAFLSRLLHGRSSRKVESGAGLFGLVCFFDGLANSLMVGRLFQSLADRSGVRRVRLAYIVDTTSAAVACLAFVSTWIAYQLSMIREGYLLAGRLEEAEPYMLFFQSIPHNYYAWFALALMALTIWRQWNFGPMATVGLDAVHDKAPEGGAIIGGIPEAETETAGLWRAWVPVAILLSSLFAGIYLDGTARMEAPRLPFAWEKLAMAFSEANVPALLIIASALASLAAWLFFPAGKRQGGEDPGVVFREGMLQLFQPVLILVMAWMLSSTLKDLGAAAFLGQLLGERLPPGLLPLMVFLTGAMVSFTTGTSWGTMGLLMPLAIPLTFAVAGGDAQAVALMPMIVGAVFSGAVFGDHCSPISDTTIVSSMACGIDPMDHVRTQLPYALLAAGGAALLGFMGGALLGGSPVVAPFALVAFSAVVLVVMRFFGSASGKT